MKGRRIRQADSILEALVDAAIARQVENFEIAIGSFRYIRRDQYLGPQRDAIPWRAFDAPFGAAAAFDAVPGRMWQSLTLSILPSYNSSHMMQTNLPHVPFFRIVEKSR
jgi:hypothetical protein